jgi:hypothetical protein
MPSLGDTIYEYYNKSSYNIYSYPTISARERNHCSPLPTAETVGTSQQQQQQQQQQQREEDVRIEQPTGELVGVSPHQSVVNSQTNASEELHNPEAPQPARMELEKDHSEVEHQAKEKSSVGEETRKPKESLVSEETTTSVSEETTVGDSAGQPVIPSDDEPVESDYTDELAEEALQSPLIDEYTSTSSSSDGKETEDIERENYFCRTTSSDKIQNGDLKDDSLEPVTLVPDENPLEREDSKEESQALPQSDKASLGSEGGEELEADESPLLGETIPDQEDTGLLQKSESNCTKQEAVSFDYSSSENEDVPELAQQEGDDSEVDSAVENQSNEDCCAEDSHQEDVEVIESPTLMEIDAEDEATFLRTSKEKELPGEKEMGVTDFNEKHDSLQNDNVSDHGEQQIESPFGAMNTSEPQTLDKDPSDCKEKESKDNDSNTAVGLRVTVTPLSPNSRSRVFVTPEEQPSKSCGPTTVAPKKRKKPITPAEFFASFPVPPPKKRQAITPAEFFQSIPLPRSLQRKVDLEAKQKRNRIRRSLARRRKERLESRDDSGLY